MRPHPYIQPMPLRGRIARPQPRGLPIVNMGFNELPYPPPEGVAQALTDTIPHVGRYGPPHNEALRDALARRHGLHPDHLICGNGSEELLDVIARIFVRPGDGIVISQYGYIQFELTAHRLGAVLTKAAERDLTTDVDALLASVDERTRLMFLANPNNPTGTLAPVEELCRLADNLPETVVLVIDLAYGEFAGERYCAAVHDLVQGRENLVVTRTFSKAYGLAGARAGWAHGPEWMIPVLYGARGMGTVNALAQAAAVAALEAREVIDARVAEIVAERDRLSAALAGIGVTGPKSHSNFLMVSPPDEDPAMTEALVEHLFDTCGIIVNRTREAGLERFFRFSLSLPEHNDLLLDGVRSFMAGR